MKQSMLFLVLLLVNVSICKHVPAQHLIPGNGTINNSFDKENGLQVNKSQPVANYQYLDINNVAAKIPSFGVLFCNGHGYYVPESDSTKSIFSAALWIGGLDENENLHLSAERYNQLGYNYLPGPLYNDGVLGNCEPNISNYFNRVWKINRNDINQFYQELLAGQPVDMFTDILEWPGTGPQGYDEVLAPYIDNNNDGFYNAAQYGDIPDMLGDQMLWWVSNDVLSDTREVEGLPMGVQVEYTLYGYVYENPPNDFIDLINYQTFLKIKIKNKSANTYHSVYAGFYVDGDLGCQSNDFIGCDVERKSFYFYNGTEIDNSCNGFLGYGQYPPIQTITLLNTPLADANGVDDDGDGVIDNEQTGMSKFVYYNICSEGNPATTDPFTPSEYYNYLRGYWKDGQPLCYGGTGHPSGGGDLEIPCDYMFFGESDTLFTGTNGVAMPPWTESGCQNIPGDRRGLVSMGPFTFESGEMVEIDVLLGFIPQDEYNRKNQMCK